MPFRWGPDHLVWGLDVRGCRLSAVVWRRYSGNGENFTCCRSCGQSEIGGEGETDAHGFVYFHSQCTDSAAAGHGLMLLYGGVDGSSETTAAIGHEVVAALEAAGLVADWDRDPDRAITVTPLEWRRRLVG